MRLNEFDYKNDVTKAIQEHIERGVPFTECMFRPGSQAFTDFYREVKRLYNEGKIEVDWQDAELLETDIGECIIVEGERVPLDVPIEIAEEAVSPDLFNSLRKGDMLNVNFSSAMSSGEITLQVKSKSRSKKYNLEKITLINPEHPGRVNFFLYKRGDKVTMAQGDLAVMVDAIELVETVSEASGEFAEPIYKLMDEVGSHEVILDDLIRYLDSDTINDFVADFRRHHDMNATESVQEAVDMCPKACCGKPVTECKCGPDCEHCDCYEKNKAMNEAQLNEKSCGEKGVKPNSPKRGGPKKFYVYVNTPSGNCKKISWGDTSGLSVKSGNRDRVRSFVARHKCKEKNDRTKAGYWACRTPRYKALGVKGGAWW